MRTIELVGNIVGYAYLEKARFLARKSESEAFSSILRTASEIVSLKLLAKYCGF